MANAGDSQQLHVACGQLWVAHHGAFGYFQQQGRRLHAMGPQHLQDLVAEAGIQDVRRGQVDRQLLR
jgi:hypothetical protein